MLAMIVPGCLTPEENENYTLRYDIDNGYGVVRYDGVVYPVGNTNTVTLENLDPQTYYPFFKNSFNSSEGYYFVNRNGQVFENLENNYQTYPIELTLCSDEDLFDWDDWFLRMG